MKTRENKKTVVPENDHGETGYLFSLVETPNKKAALLLLKKKMVEVPNKKSCSAAFKKEIGGGAK